MSSTQGAADQATLSARVAEEIRGWMGKRRVTGAELARRLGVSQMWVSYRLSGKQPIDLNDLEVISKTLGVPVRQLLPNDPAGSSPWYDRIAQTAISRKPDPATSRPRPGRPANRPSGPSRPIILPAVRRPRPRFATLPGTGQRPGGVKVL